MSSKPQQPVSLLPTEELRRLLRGLADGAEGAESELWVEIRRVARTIEPSDVWHPRDSALSFWVLLLNGVDHGEEVELAKDLLFWQEIYAGPLAKTRCIQSSERELFAFCSRFFGFASPPVLILSDDPFLNRYIRIEGQLLSKLCKERSLSGFLTKLHMQILHGRDLEHISNDLRTEAFWRTIRVIYKEIKDLVTIQISGGP